MLSLRAYPLSGIAARSLIRPSDRPCARAGVERVHLSEMTSKPLQGREKTG